MKEGKIKDWRDCNYRACAWDHRYQILGLVLMILATVLTILTLDSFGIAIMFIVGLILLIYKQIKQCCGCCPCSSDTSCELTTTVEDHKVKPTTTTKKPKL